MGVYTCIVDKMEWERVDVCVCGHICVEKTFLVIMYNNFLSDNSVLKGFFIGLVAIVI